MKMSEMAGHLAYALWIFRGSNKLDELTFYDKEFEKFTDDGIHLRGAYGPRLRQWIGADQLQECINANKDIDNPEDFEKPKGVDQFEKVYNDLKAGMKVSSCIIFDPSIDFDPSNDIPDLVAIQFYNEGNIFTLSCLYNLIKGDKESDKVFLSILGQFMARLLNNELKGIYYNGCPWESLVIEDYKITNPTPENLWADVHKVFEVEHYVRNSINEKSINLPKVDCLTIADQIIEKFVTKIECEFWKEICYFLLSYVFLKFGKDTAHKEYVEKVLIGNIKGALKNHLTEF